LAVLIPIIAPAMLMPDWLVVSDGDVFPPAQALGPPMDRLDDGFLRAPAIEIQVQDTGVAA
jgi:hypothetical protein